MDFNSNSQLQLAYNFVQYTGENIFLTGKAGTGKTTFLHFLKNHSPKRMVVVAPTGVAAINALGVTIHSFFQLSFGPQLPEYSTIESTNGKGQIKINRFNKEKINIIKSMDLLVIDEVSMVRSDLLDGIDNTLRRFRNKNLPFGGVQLLMIGDLQQLAPVVKEDEWNLLRQHYDTPFFFSSKALIKTQYVSIELKHVYRQKDQKFIKLLNKIRDNKMDKDVVNELNARYKPDFNSEEEAYIILTTHNAKAKQINDFKLNRLPGNIHAFQAIVSDNFPEYAYPTDFELKLKQGTQVMFIKNDPSPSKQFYNGKIGTVINIDEDTVTVKCEADEEPINVVPLEWQKMKYSLNNETKEIKEIVEGTFVQYPLKPAWAITIHKSQGLTFEKVIIDAQAAFAHGQVYVALSRCTSLEGIVLSTRIQEQSVKHDKTVEAFTKNYEENQPDKLILEASQKAYQQQLLTDLFNFDLLQKYIYFSIKLFKEHTASLQENPVDDFRAMNTNVKTKITDVSTKFHTQLLNFFSKNDDIEKDAILQDRIQKAAVYFSKEISDLVTKPIDNLTIETDNKTVRKSIKDVTDKLLTEALFKLSCLRACQNGFVVKNYLQAKAKASIDDKVVKKPTRRKTFEQVSASISHPELYQQIRTWRDAKADELNWEAYMVLPLKTMRELSTKLPVTGQALKVIKGLGKKKLEKFGNELLEMIILYCEENNIKGNIFKDIENKPKIPKINSKQISFELWKEGKTIAEIAKERQLVTSTIESHLAYFIGIGEIEITKIISVEKIKRISDFFQEQKVDNLSEAKKLLGDDITYGELRMVLQYINNKSQEFDSES